MHHFALSLAASLLFVLPALAQEALLDDRRLPFGGTAAQGAYRSFLAGNLPRAFALSSDGKTGARWGTATLTDVRIAALASCAEKGGKDCAIYAEDLTVVWPKLAAPAPPPAPPGPLIAGPGFSFDPDPRYIWWGPARAKGIYVFAHGRDINRADARGAQPQAHVRFFNNAGYDVVRFDREPNGDNTDAAAGWLRAGLRDLRARGWKSIIAGGQSRGGWNSLQILDTPGLADTVIAIAAATMGVNATMQNSTGGAELYKIFTAAKAPQTRVVIANFKDDPFEQNPDKRFAMARELLAPRVGALLLIDQPPGITGHGGGASNRFATDFAACILRFATAPTPPSAC